MKIYKNLCLMALTSFAIIVAACKSSNEGENASPSKEITSQNPEIPSEQESDYAVLKTKTLDLINANEAEIAAFKSKLNTETAANKIKFQKEIDSLMAKNTALKSSLSNYKEQGKAKLSTFKARLQKSIDDINKDIDTYKSEHK